ncbi:MAG: DUF3098 domain-containing protein [Bacteroidota bacterium]|nr:DUF3098 domain-containing protein [Bacteroidota bacterium]
MEKKKKHVTAEKPAPSTPKVTVSTSTPKQTQQASKTGQFAFGKENYRLLLIGLVFIVAGFLLMIGGGSKDPNVFNPDIFSFRRITLAPILILAGYVIEIFAIMKKPKD